MDIEATRLARENGTLLDSRSFVTRPSLYDGKPHLRLYGEDIGEARKRACKRATDAIGFMRCQSCGWVISDDYHDIHPRKAEMDHIERESGKRCDCDSNLRMICHREHSARHNQ